MDKNTNPHDLPIATATATPVADKPGERLRHVPGLDVDLHFGVTAASTARLLKKLQHHAEVGYGPRSGPITYMLYRSGPVGKGRTVPLACVLRGF